MKHLIIGGARSGKSRIAQELAIAWQQQTCGSVMVIATAAHQDSAMEKRIAHHRRNRPQNWQVIEIGSELTQTLLQHSAPDRLILVDCLTLWLSHALYHSFDWSQQKQALLDALPHLAGDVIFVSNEVGQGVVPLGEICRQFVDESGWLHQHLAQRVERVTSVIAGLPLVLKSPPSERQ